MRFPEQSGSLTFDFVWDVVAPLDVKPMGDAEFEILLRTTIQKGMSEDSKLQIVEQASQMNWFSGYQLEKLILVHQGEWRFVMEVSHRSLSFY